MNDNIMWSSKKLFSTIALIAILASSFPIYNYVSLTPSILNGYNVSYVDIMGIKHISVGDPSQDRIPYHGVVTYTFKHHDGQTYAVVNSHNTRLVMGITCFLDVGFAHTAGGLTSGNTTCTLGRTSQFTGWASVGIVNGSSGSAFVGNGSDTYPRSVFGGNRACGTVCGLISTGTAANQGGPEGGSWAGSTFSSIVFTSNAFTFAGDKSGASANYIRGAFLMNATTGTPTAFAENGFTGVTVANGDSLTVTWNVSMS